ncbi:unnamed protein product, partial [Scytosiphon promiscuus]
MLVWNPLPPGGCGGAHVRGGVGLRDVQLHQQKGKSHEGEEQKEEKREAQRDRSSSFEGRIAAAVALSLSEAEKGNQEKSQKEEGESQEEKGYLEEEEKDYEEGEKEREETREDGRSWEGFQRGRHHAYVVGRRESSAADVGRVGIGAPPGVAAEGPGPGRGEFSGEGGVVFGGVNSKHYVGDVVFAEIHAELVAEEHRLRVAVEEGERLVGLLLDFDNQLDRLHGGAAAPAATAIPPDDTGAAVRGGHSSSRGGRGSGTGMRVSSGMRTPEELAGRLPVSAVGPLGQVHVVGASAVGPPFSHGGAEGVQALDLDAAFREHERSAARHQ